MCVYSRAHLVYFCVFWYVCVQLVRVFSILCVGARIGLSVTV